MFKYYEGTIFNTDADALVNTVNCIGVMGAGIALEFMLRYPEMFKKYEADCKAKLYMPGTVYYYKDTEKLLVNFPTKWHFRYPSKIEWIESGLKSFCETYSKYNIKSVAFPKLGTNNGGLSWNEVKILMEKYLSQIDIDAIICLDEKKEAEGIEKQMLDLFNSTSSEELGKIARLNNNQREIIEKEKPFDRFWKVSKIKGIGSTTYKKLFGYYYDSARNGNDNGEQLSFL